MQETTTPEAPEVEQGGLTEEGAVQQLLGKWAKAEQPAAEEAETDQQPEQAQADAPEAEPVEEEPQPEEDADIELDVAGEKFKVPRAFAETATKIQAKAKEVEAGATRKFQEAAELRKAVETERAAVVQLRKIAEGNADLLADHRMVTRRMQQLESVDINSTDADTLARYNAEYMQLQAAKGRIEAAYQQNVNSAREEEAKALKAKQEHAERIVSQRIKGWGVEKQKELAEYAMSRGAPAEALNSITEAWMVEILEDAAYGRKMREHKTTVEKRVIPNTPTLRPGAASAQPRAEAKAKEAMQRLSKSHSVSDAAMALLARSNARKR